MTPLLWLKRACIKGSIIQLPTADPPRPTADPPRPAADPPRPADPRPPTPPGLDHTHLLCARIARPHAQRHFNIPLTTDSTELRLKTEDSVYQSPYLDETHFRNNDDNGRILRLRQPYLISTHTSNALITNTRTRGHKIQTIQFFQLFQNLLRTTNKSGLENTFEFCFAEAG